MTQHKELVERLRKRCETEASRQNSAYDRYGWDNTPQSVDPDVWKAADTIEQLVSALSTSRKETDSISQAKLVNELRARGYWQRTITLTSDGGWEDEWITREGFEARQSLSTPSTGESE